MSNDDGNDDANDDAVARRRRAVRLREQIAGLTGRKGPGEKQAEDKQGGGEPSPRSFIERRMRELDKGKTGGEAADGKSKPDDESGTD
jgi:hypothetical protein